MASLAQLGLARQLEAEVACVVAVDCRREVVVARLGQLRLFVQQGEDPLRLGLHQIDAILKKPIIDLGGFHI